MVIIECAKFTGLKKWNLHLPQKVVYFYKKNCYLTWQPYYFKSCKNNTIKYAFWIFTEIELDKPEEIVTASETVEQKVCYPNKLYIS